MAELDEKLLKNLDQTLQNMNTHLQNLESTLRGVKGGIDAAFNPSVIKAFSDEIRGLQAARIIDADKNVAEVNKIYSAIQELSYMVKTGMKLEPVSLEQLDQYKKRLEEIDKLLEPLAGKRGLPTDKWLERQSLYRERDSLRDILDSENPVVPVPLKKEEIAAAVEALKRYEDAYKNIRKGEQQRAAELATIAQKERTADLQAADASITAREQAERKKAEIARAWNEREIQTTEEAEKRKLQAEQMYAEERRKLLESDAKKRQQMEQMWRDQEARDASSRTDINKLGDLAATPGLTGTLAALQDDSALRQWRKETAEEQKSIAREEAEVEKQIKKEIAEEERKLAEEERQRLKEAQEANKALTKAEDDLAEAKRKARASQSKAAYKQQAQEESAATKKMSDAIKQQITYYRQLHSLYKEYKALQAKPNKTKEDNAVLEQTKQKILEILRLSKQLELENKGSAAIAKQATEFERVRDRAREARGETQKMGDSLNKLLPTLQRLASAFGVAFSVRSLAQFGKKLIEVRGEFELQQVALRSILQNKQLADEIWDKTMQAALQSPFTAMQLTRYTKQLAAYRIETDKLFETTKRLADVSAGLGVDMQRLILAYGQVKAANYLRASEIRQFTEAGVNILGELSEYFSKTRDGMYDTAKVMEMVTKRMVKFEDVEAIFKKMTDQGGIFYDMQRVQSQTVKGQIAKLHDAYDQMLNSMGKANEGVLKDLVSVLNSIVKNWRTWAVVLKSIASGAVIAYLSKFALPLMGIGKASVSTLRSVVKLKQGIQSLGTTLKANLPLLGIFAATAVISALNNLRKKFNEVNKEIDEQNLRLYETRQNFESMKSKIEENNKAIKDEKSSTEKLNKAQKENEGIMQKLRNEYPQLAEQMKIATNGFIDMNDAIDANIRKLNEQMTVLNAMKQGTWFSDSDMKNLQDWEGALATMKTTIISAQSEARRKIMQMEIDEDTENPLYGLYKKVEDIDFSKGVPEAVEQFNELDKEFRKLNVDLTDLNEITGEFYSNTDLASDLGIKKGKLQANWSEARVNEVLDRLYPTLQRYYENGIKDNADFLKEINEQYDGNVTAFIQANAEKINQATIDGLNNANSILINTLKPQTEEMKNFLNQRLNELFGTSGIDYFAKAPSTTTQTSPETQEDKQSKIDAAWRRRIRLLEEMKKRYDELAKSAYGYAKSEKTTRDAFDESFKEIFKGTGIDMSQIDFTSMAGMMESMKVVLAKAKGVSDAVKEEIMKKIDSFEAQITINAQVKIREDFGKQMEEMFSNYDLTLDLEKLELPTDELSGIFGFDYKTLNDLRNAVDEFYNKQLALGDDPTELVKQVEGYYKKIDEMEKKELRERLKTYTKYLAEGRAEALKIHMDELKKMSDLDELYQKGYFTETQYKDISDKIKKETNERLAKNDWQQFKESEFYVTMFEDLSKVSSKSIDIMVERLKNLRSSINDLDPKQAKEIVKVLEKLEKAKMERSPLKSFLNDLKTARSWFGRKDELGKRLGFYAQGEEYWSSEQEKQAKKVAELRVEYDRLVKNGEIGDAKDVKALLDFEESELRYINKNLEDRKEKLDETNKELNDGYAALMRLIGALDTISKYSQQINSSFESFKDMMDSLGTDTDTDAWDAASTTFNALASTAATIASSAAKFAAGDYLGGSLDAIKGIFDLVTMISQYEDRKIDREIERQQERIDSLTRAYERLEKQIEKTFDSVSYMRAYNSEVSNLNIQIEALNAQMAAEEAKKSTDKDKIQGYKDAIQDAEDKLDELKQKQIEVFGGVGEDNYRSAAQGFVEAWKSAFLETGDGLQGLQDHFDEFLNDWFVKQMTMRVAGRMLEPLFAQIDQAVDQYGMGGTDTLFQELEAIRDKFEIIAPKLADALEDSAHIWGLEGKGSLSGLAAGIQGMTEEQANILEAYWNSVRMYTSSIDQNVATIVNILSNGSGGISRGVDYNPQLQELKAISYRAERIDNILHDVWKAGHPQGAGGGFKVFVN